MSTKQEWWNEGLADVCAPFQVDISCLVDGELDEAAAARAMVHLEDCTTCRAFFEETRQCVRLHRDVADPDRLIARLSTLIGADFSKQAQAIEHVHRLATIFYQLGKAYLLSALDPDFRTRVFESALPVETTQSLGRGFVDGVLHAQGDDEAESRSRIDWNTARTLFNGRLKEIATPLEKGRRLLDEAIQADPSHEEARLYLAFLAAREGKTLKAAREYKDLFQTSISEQNRGHAAIQLGLLHDREGDHRKALACFRWVTMSGLADRDERFFFVRFNQALEYALLGRAERSLAAFRALLDKNPGRAGEVAELILKSKNLQEAMDALPGYGEALLASCPELFQAPGSEGGGGATGHAPKDRADGQRERPQ
jgi:tetratricopeptide (TPR) repeat protein